MGERNVILPAEATTDQREHMQAYSDLLCPGHTTWDQETLSMYVQAVKSAPSAGRVSRESLEAAAKAIHDTHDMTDTVWPDSELDDGYRGCDGFVRLCREPDLLLNAARNAFHAAGLEIEGDAA